MYKRQLYEKPRRKSTVTLEEAKALYPEWYEKRIVQGEPKQKSKKQGGTWVCNEALYEWWKRKITEEVKAGGRYFSIMASVSYTHLDVYKRQLWRCALMA